MRKLVKLSQEFRIFLSYRSPVSFYIFYIYLYIFISTRERVYTQASDNRNAGHFLVAARTTEGCRIIDAREHKDSLRHFSQGKREFLTITEKDVTAAVLTAGDVINRRCLIGHAIFIPAHSEPVTSTGLLSAVSGPARITGTSRAAIRRPQFASVMFPSLLKF